MACIYIYWREENNNNNSYPNLNMIYIDVPVFWNITSSPAPTSSTSPTRYWSTSFFFSSLSGIPRQRMESVYMHRNILLRVSYIAATRCNASIRHFPRYIFHDRERYNQITWLERNKNSWTYVTAPVQPRGGQCEWWNNGGKFRRLKKEIIKNRFSSESKNCFRERHCLMCRFGWENKKKSLWAFYIWRKSKKNNFAGGLGSKYFIRC